MTTWSQPFTMTLHPTDRYPLTAVPAGATHPTIVVLIKNLGPGNLLVGANTLIPGRFVFSSFANLTIETVGKECSVEVTFSSPPG